MPSEDSRGLFLILGGEKERELAAVEKFKQIVPQYTELKAIVSSGEASDDDIEKYCRDLSLKECVQTDRSAVDTVTNFTTTQHYIETYGANEVIIATSRYHMRRAFAVGWIIFSLRKVKVSRCVVNVGRRESEHFIKVIRDCLRAIAWILFGLHFGCIATVVHPERKTHDK